MEIERGALWATQILGLPLTPTAIIRIRQRDGTRTTRILREEVSGTRTRAGRDSTAS